MTLESIRRFLRESGELRQEDRKEIVFFALCGLASFLPFIGRNYLFDWDEINFGEAAREMIVSGDYLTVQIGFEPFWEKPPLFFWLQSLSFHVFGINEFAARLPNALLGIAVIPSLYVTGTRILGRTFGRFAAGIFFATLLSHAYFKTGIIDPVFNFFIFLALFKLLSFEISRKEDSQSGNSIVDPHFIAAGFWTGLAVLTKGPVGLLLVALTYAVFRFAFDRRNIPWKQWTGFILIFCTIVASWFGAIYFLTSHGSETLRRFYHYHVQLLSEDVAGHAQPFWYHLVVFTLLCFPMAAFCFRGMFTAPSGARERMLKIFMLCWWWVVMIVFSIVKTKIIHYSSLIYYPSAFLGALYLRELVCSNRRIHLDVIFQLLLGIVLFGIGAIFLVFAWSNEWLWRSLVADPGISQMIQFAGSWSGWEYLPGLVFLVTGSLAIYFLLKKRPLAFLLTQMIATAGFLNVMNLTVVTRISEMVQSPVIRFWEENAERDVYMVTGGYKSYAHWFYGRIPDHDKKGKTADEFENWQTNGDVDKDVVMAARRVQVTEQFRKEWYYNFEETGSAGTFVFFLRKAEKRKASPK